MKQKSLFFAAVVAVFFLFGFHKIMFLRPTSVHQWRQCDSAAYAFNYYDHNAPFFFPETMTLLGENGRTISEFPIIYYTAAQFYKVFGFHEWILRLLTFGFFVFGLYYLFKLGQMFFVHEYWAFFPPFFLMASPLLSYYALNFLPNVPGLGFSLVSWYFFYNFIKKRTLRDFIICSMAAMFAALLKPVEIFNYGAMLAICVFEYFGLFGLKKIRFDKKTTAFLLLSAIVTIGVNCVWIVYAKWYAERFGYIGNLLEVLPIWRLTFPEIRECWQVIRTKWLYQMYYPYVYGFLMLATVAIVVFNKKIDRHLFISWLLVLFSQIAFVLLFFQTFYHHDYYWINTLIFVAFTLLCCISLVEKMKFSYANIVAPTVFSLFFLITIKHSRFIIQERYFGNLREELNPVLLHLKPYLRSIGIQKEDKVISVPDRSPNISLYFMEQKGWSECYTNEQRNIKHFVEQGAKYLIVNKEIDRKKEWYTPYLKNQIGEFEGVKIYKLF